MTYRIDGIPPLDYPPDLGWVFRSLSNPLASLAFTRPELRNIGRDGTVPGLPAWVSAPELDLVVMTPRANAAALIALVRSGTSLDDSDGPGRSIHYELLESSPVGYGNGGDILDITFRVRYPAVYWRDDITTTTTAVNLETASQAVAVFPGISAPIPRRDPSREALPAASVSPIPPARG